MTDRELLDLAAKAAQLPIEWRADYVSVHDFTSEQPRHIVSGFTSYVYDNEWNPLTNDGDALRLAAQLRLTISWDRFDDDDYAIVTPPNSHQGQGQDCMVDQSPYAATRLAIVRAAAEIGRSLP